MALGLNKFKAWLHFAPLLAMGLLFIGQSLSFSLHDFTNYYFGAKLWLLGDFAPSTYLPCTFNEQLAQLDFYDYFGNYAPNSPFLLLFFAPFTYLPPLVAKTVFNGIGLLVFAVSFYRLQQAFSIPKSRVLLISLVLVLAIRNNLLFGQAYLVLAALIMEFSINYAKQKFWLSTFWLALASALKLFPALLILLFIVRRDFKPLPRYIFWMLVISLITLWCVGTEVSFFYLTKVLPASLQGRLSEEFVLNYQSVHMWSKALFTALPQYYPAPLLDLGPNASSVFNALFAGSVLCAGIGFTWRSSVAQSIGIWLVIGLLITPYGSSYSLIILGLATALGFQPENRKQFWVAVAILALISVFRYSWLAAFPVYLQFPKLLFIVALFIIFIKDKAFVAKPIFFAIIGMFISLKVIFTNNSHERKEYAISPQSLVCDYEIEGNTVILKGLNKQGEQQWVEMLGPCTSIEMSATNRGLGYYTLYCKER